MANGGDVGPRDAPWLILVRHSQPQIDLAVPAGRWHLSPEGEQRCLLLAERLAEYEPDLIVSSTEPKAVETARAVAHRLGLPFKTSLGLHEHDRSSVLNLDRGSFHESVARLFAHPGELVFGRETADQARKRFRRAIDDLLLLYPRANLVVVTHGTVLALYVATLAGMDAYFLWQQLSMPSFAVLDRPPLRLVGLAESLDVPVSPL